MEDLKKVRVQLLNPDTNEVVEEVNVLTSADSVLFDDGKTLVDKIAEGFDGGNAATVNGHTVEANVPADAKFTDTIYEHPETHAATMIVEDEEHRFVTDEEKAKWNTEVTKESLGLNNVTNDAQVKRSEMGVAGGVATLDEAGKVVTSQLPSYVDDVLEYDSEEEFPEEGESGKIYVDIETNKTYRWGGTTYVEISASLALGETASTAYAGDKGKANAEQIALNVEAIAANAQAIEENGKSIAANAKAIEDNGKAIAANGELIAANTEAIEANAEDIEANAGEIAKIKDGSTVVPKANDAATVNGKTVAVDVPADAKFTDTTYVAATESADGLMAAADKVKLDGLEHVKYGTEAANATEVKLFFKVV